MEAQDILDATHKLEASGMTRSQSETIAETIIAAVAPLATRKDLEGMQKDLEANRADIASLSEETRACFTEHRKETKAEFAALREETRAEFAAQREETKAGFAAIKEHMATKKDVESMKVWLLITLLGLVGSILGVVIGSALF